jgi:hypothetical protein
MNKRPFPGSRQSSTNDRVWVDALTDYERRLALRFAFIRSERASTYQASTIQNWEN